MELIKIMEKKKETAACVKHACCVSYTHGENSSTFLSTFEISNDNNN